MTQEEQVIKKLTEGGVNEAAIDALRKADLLDADLLETFSRDDLAKCVTMGMAGKIKKVYPGTATASTPTAPVPAIPADVRIVTKRTNRMILDDLATNPDADIIAEARGAFTGKCFVTTGEGKLDVEATLKAMEFAARGGRAITRYKNSEGISVALVNIDGLLATVIARNPMNGTDLVPGDPLLEELTAEQRLLLAFACVRRHVRADENVDLLIQQINENGTTWQQRAHELARAKVTSHADYQAAKARCERVTGNEGDGADDLPGMRPKRLGSLLGARRAYTGDLRITAVRAWLDANYTLEELKTLIATLNEQIYIRGTKLDWDNLSGDSKVLKIMALVDHCNRQTVLADLLVPFGRPMQAQTDWEWNISRWPVAVTMELYSLAGEDFGRVAALPPKEQAATIIQLLTERQELELIPDFVRRNKERLRALEAFHFQGR